MEVKRIDTNHITMKIYDDGTGKINLDDLIGWRHSGDKDQFLLNLLRISTSRINELFLKKMHESTKNPDYITKKEIISAIKKSMELDPSDGLYHILGDNAMYDWDDKLVNMSYDDAYEIEKCIKDNYYTQEKAQKIADNIRDRIDDNLPSLSDILDETRDELTEDWKNHIDDAIEQCDEENIMQLSPFFRKKISDAANFISCVAEKAQDFKEDVTDVLFENISNKYYEERNITDDFLKEISEKHEIPVDVLQHCSRGGYGPLHKPPIPDNQTFLDSFGD
jgi:chemotaxis regulatin CheY-phosphate phosphatase CheZ